MGSQFSEEFLLGYRAGHRDGFADAVLRMRDATTVHHQRDAVTGRIEQLSRLLTGHGLLAPPRSQEGGTEKSSAREASSTA